MLDFLYKIGRFVEIFPYRVMILVYLMFRPFRITEFKLVIALIKLLEIVGKFIIPVGIGVFLVTISQDPFDKIIGRVLSAFALTIALCGLCFGIARALPKTQSSQTMEYERSMLLFVGKAGRKMMNDKDLILYAGEKTFHSAIIIFEYIILKYGTDYTREYAPYLEYLTKALDIILFIMLGTGMVFLAKGLLLVDRFFWKRYEDQTITSLKKLFRQERLIKYLLKRKLNDYDLYVAGQGCQPLPPKQFR